MNKDLLLLQAELSNIIEDKQNFINSDFQAAIEGIILKAYNLGKKQ